MNNILAIASSPRRHGNSETLLGEVLSAFDKKNFIVKKIVLSDLNILPCNGCQACFKTGRCIIKDDMQALYKGLLACDILLVASPIYFQGLPCQLKCAIDRCQALWARKYILKKTPLNKNARRIGGAILVSASAGAANTFKGAIITLKALFKTLDILYKKELLVEGLEEKSDAAKNRVLLKKAYVFGKNLFTEEDK